MSDYGMILSRDEAEHFRLVWDEATKGASARGRVMVLEREPTFRPIMAGPLVDYLAQLGDA